MGQPTHGCGKASKGGKQLTRQIKIVWGNGIKTHAIINHIILNNNITSTIF